ncbi:hypothetical protein [Glutamicibacter creatinolyticus]|uniref:hypothetical protein n=1 Tax=Glutamicibacter creatinolyticus TaxID=162496 RepID=UPI00321790A0
MVVNGPKPPKPAGFSASAQPGLIELRWNGKFEGDATSPLDLKHVAGYVVASGEYLDLSDQAGVMTGELGDNIQVQVTAGAYHVYFVAWSLAGKFSEAAGPVPVLVTAPADPIEIQGALDDLNERYDGVITEAGNLGSRLNQAEHELTEHDQRLGKNETDVNEALAGDVDIDRLAIGNGVIRDLVAQHIAGKTAAFQEVDIKNLFVTTGTLTEAVINRLWADVIMSRKITAQMMAIGSFDNLIVDPDFTGDGSGWNMGDATVDPTGGRAGVPAAKLINKSAHQSVNSLPMRVAHDGESYRLTVWLKSDTEIPASGVILYLRSYNINGGYTYRSITSPVIPADTWYRLSGVVEVPPNSKGINFQVSSRNNFATGTLWFDYVSATRASDGELVVDGSVTAEKVAANAIKAYHADFDSFFADTGFVSQLQAKGIRLVNSDGAVTVNLTGEGEKLFTFNNPLDEDETLLAFDEEGGIAAQELNVAGNARMDGVLVAGGDPITDGHLGTEVPGQWGPVFNGRSLLGNTYMTYVEEHPVVSDSYSWLSPLPHGVIANGWNTRTDNLNSNGEWEWEGRNGSTDARMMLVVTADFRDQRMYSLAYRAPAIGDVGGGTTNVGAALVRRSSDGGRVSAGDGAVVPGSRIYLPGGGVYTAATAVTYLRCPEDIPAGRIMLGVEVYVYGNRKAVSSSTSDARRWELTVVDMGVKRPTNDGDEVDLRQRDNSPPPPAPTPKPPAPKQYRETVPASWWQAYTGDNSQATHSTYSGRAAQGRTPYATSNGVMRGLIGFPSQASRLSGAKVKKIEVYVYAEKWHAGAGGTAVIGTHGHGSKPGSWSSTSNDVKRQKMKRGDGQWITLPSSVHAGFKSGSLRGISFYPPGGSTSTEYYGLFSGSKTKLRITYEK